MFKQITSISNWLFNHFYFWITSTLSFPVFLAVFTDLAGTGFVPLLEVLRHLYSVSPVSLFLFIYLFFGCLKCQTPSQSTFILMWYSSTVNPTISLPIHNSLYKISNLNHMALFLLFDWMMVSALLGHKYLICK